jgi:hypothetical protein
MTENSPEKDVRKEAMKALRKARKKQIAAASIRMKEHNKAIKALKAILTGDGATVPAIVEQTNMPSAQVFWYLASLKKYGEVLEGDKDGSYFRYRLAAADIPRDESPE